MRTTAIMNLKGGTAKTVTAINMAAILAEDYDQRILLIDADSQGNLTEFMARDPEDAYRLGSVADLLQNGKGYAYPTKLDGVWILEADDRLMELDVTAVSTGKVNAMAISDYLAAYEELYDWCIIDCPPAFTATAMAALIAADEVGIPMKVDAFGIRGMSNLLEQIRNMRRVNADLELAGVLPTMVYPDPSQREAEQKLRAELARATITTFPHIRRSVSVDKMTFTQQALIHGAPRSGACRDYRNFCKRLLAMDPDWEGGEL